MKFKVWLEMSDDEYQHLLWIAEAWRYLQIKASENMSDREQLQHARRTSKSYLDNWLMRHYHLDPSDARMISNMSAEQNAFQTGSDSVRWSHHRWPEPTPTDLPDIDDYDWPDKPLPGFLFPGFGDLKKNR